MLLLATLPYVKHQKGYCALLLFCSLYFFVLFCNQLEYAFFAKSNYIYLFATTDTFWQHLVYFSENNQPDTYKGKMQFDLPTYYLNLICTLICYFHTSFRLPIIMNLLEHNILSSFIWGLQTN